MAPFQGSNFRIYTVLGAYFREHGSLPDPEVLVAESVPGSFADFPGLSLWLYRLLLGHGGVSEAMWGAYQIGTVAFVGLLLARWGIQTGLTTKVARLTALTALLCAVVVAVPLEDKTYYFWLPTLAFLALSLNLWAGTSLIGLFAGWTGLAPLAVLLSALRSGRSVAVRLTSTGLSIVVAIGAFFAVGPLTTTLVSNRSMRESADSFWYSLWQLGGPLDNPPFRMGFYALLIISAVTAYALGWTNLPATVVVMSAGTLLSSNSTVPVRVIMLLPLGVYLCSTIRLQVLFLLGLLGWSGLLAMSSITDTAQYPASTDLLLAMQIGYVNAPLIALILLWLKSLPWHDLRHRQEPASPFSPNAGYEPQGCGGDDHTRLPT